MTSAKKRNPKVELELQLRGLRAECYHYDIAIYSTTEDKQNKVSGV